MRLSVTVRLAIAAAAVGVGGCQWTGLLHDPLGRSGPRERYAEALQRSGALDTLVGREWVTAAAAALRNPIATSPPIQETGFFSHDAPRAIAYRLPLKRGQRLVVELESYGPAPVQVFGELYTVGRDGRVDERPGASVPLGHGRLEYEARRDEPVVVRVQAELFREGRYILTQYVTGALLFPVEGRTTAAVQSGFGDPRNGGTRDHHGVDIFARRGTPVLAATDGLVTRVDATPRGGNVVWLWDPSRMQSLYYAHLDRSVVSSGTLADRGDVLGYVGNTGNARTTPPHLHFGIYAPGAGPLDPLPFIRVGTPPDAGAFRRRTALQVQRVVAREAALRNQPRADAPAVTMLRRDTLVQPLAVLGGWWRVELPDRTTGFLRWGVTETAREPAPHSPTGALVAGAGLAPQEFLNGGASR